MANKILDPAKNFGIVTCSGSYTSTNTVISLSSSSGTRLPNPSSDGSFNVSWWNWTDYKNSSDDPKREIVRVTVRTTNSVTITRPSSGNSYLGEGSENIAQTHSASSKTYKMSLAWTKRNADYVDTFLDRTGMHASTATSSGTDGYVISVSDGITAYRAGQIFTFKANTYSRAPILIEDCEDGWTPGGGWTTCATSTNSKSGSASVKNTYTLNAENGAYENTGTLDLSKHKVVGLWAKCSIVTTASTLWVGLASGTGGSATSIQKFYLSPMSTTGTWTYNVLTMTDPSLFNSVDSIYAGASTGCVVYYDDIRAYPSININSLGYKIIKRNCEEDISTGDIRTNGIASVMYTDDGWFELMNSPAERTGDIRIVPYSTIPDGWLQCDGKTFSSTTYPELYDVIGTTFGTGPNTPNLKARVPVGLDALGGDTGYDGIGDSGGAKTVTLTEAQMPQHSGHVDGTTTVRKANSSYDPTVVQSVSTVNKGSSNSHNNMPPYLVLNYIIKT